MSNEKIGDIQQENKKAFPKFILFMIISTLLGAVVGVLAVKFAKSGGGAVADGIMSVLRIITPYANLVLIGVSTIVVTALYQSSKKRFQAWDGEDEDELDAIECFISYALYITSIGMIIAFFFFAAGVNVFRFEEMHSAKEYIPVICWFVSFLLEGVFMIVSQKKLIDFTKEINPEKKGSIYDTKFNEKWEESCDEAERLQIYKAAYKAFRSTGMTCLALWMFCLIGSVIWDIGLLPVAIVTLIWGVQITSYTMECMRLSKRNK